MTSRFGLGKQQQQIRGVQPEQRIPCMQSTRFASDKSLAACIHREKTTLESVRSGYEEQKLSRSQIVPLFTCNLVFSFSSNPPPPPRSSQGGEGNITMLIGICGGILHPFHHLSQQPTSILTPPRHLLWQTHPPKLPDRKAQLHTPNNRPSADAPNAHHRKIRL